jgi:hypothetical protein
MTFAENYIVAMKRHSVRISREERILRSAGLNPDTCKAIKADAVLRKYRKPSSRYGLD